MNLPRLRKGSFLITLILMAVYHSSCATTTGPSVSSQEVDSRRKELEAKSAQFKIRQVARVRAISQRLITFMPAEDQEKLKDLQYQVSDSADINAGVTPNKMVVNYGMLRFVESDDELAVVIGHELAHLAKGHYGKKVAIGVVATTVGLAAGAAVEGITQGSGVGGMVAKGVSRGISGGFSKEYEREADYFGFQYVYLAGFDLAAGSAIWERFAIEAPSTMTRGLFATHPASPERLIRAEKTLAELVSQGITPNNFNRPSGAAAQAAGQGLLGRTLGLPAKAVTMPLSTAVSAVTSPMQFVNSNQNSSGQPASRDQDQSEVQNELETLRQEIKRLKEAEGKRKKDAEQSEDIARQQADMERVLLEAKEAAKELRYAEFGLLDMGLAKKVTNLWLGKKVTGEQLIFPLSQGSVDWFAQYEQWSSNSWKALGLQHRKYRAYWYAPNGRLFSEQDFMQSKVRAEFAKTTLKWDPELGKFLTGKWLVRIFEDGKLLDERTFEIIANN